MEITLPRHGAAGAGGGLVSRAPRALLARDRELFRAFLWERERERERVTLHRETTRSGRCWPWSR